MDVSPVQSKSGSSDFSIERILSEDLRQEDSKTPSWLCCTRYQPPRIPRAAGGGVRARRSGRHARVPFTAAQAQALEAAYSRAPYLAPPALRALAAALHLRDDRIKIWFQNRRARERREKSSTIVPPHIVVPLPPTTVSRSLLPTPWVPVQGIMSVPSHSTSFTHSRSPEVPLSASFSSSVSEESDDDRYAKVDRSETPVDVESLEGHEGDLSVAL